MSQQTVDVFIDGIGERTATLKDDGHLFVDEMDLGTPEEFAASGGMNFVLPFEEQA